MKNVTIWFSKLNWLLALVLMLASNQAWSSVGSVVLAVGELKIERGNQTLQAGTGSEVQQQDWLRTANQARAQVQFVDNTVITLGSATDFSIAEYMDELSGAPVASFSVTKGSFKAITGKIGKVAPEKFTLSTKTATIGIRGTIFSGVVSVGGDKIAVLSGAITVTEQQTGLAVDLVAGQITEVIPGQAPAAPREFEPAELEEMAMALAESAEQPADNAAADEIETAELADSSIETAGAPMEALEVASLDLGEEAVENFKEQRQITDTRKEIVEAGFNSSGKFAGLSGPHVGSSAIDFTEWELNDVNGNIPAGIYGALDDSYYEGKFATEYFTLRAVDGGDITWELDNYVGWGSYIRENPDPNEYLVGGVFNDLAAEHIAGLMAGNSNTVYNYNGKLLGEMSISGDLATPIENSAINLNFNFGTRVVDGSFSLNASNGAMTGVLTGEIIQNEGFFVSQYGSSGSLDGRFFGPNAEQVGGTFSFLDDSQGAAAYGVFRAKR